MSRGEKDERIDIPDGPEGPKPEIDIRAGEEVVTDGPDDG